MDAIQEQLAAARRNQILDAAAAVFAQKGYHPTTIKDIARAAGIGEGTIYNYFENKPALLLGVFERMRESIQPTEIPNVAEMSFRAFLRLYLQHPLMALREDNFALFRVIVSEMLVNPELRALYYERILAPTLAMGEQLLLMWAEQHRIPPERTAVTIRVLSGLVLGLMLEHIMGDLVLQAEWDGLPDVLVDLLLHGLGNEAL
jgi:TetR/AcrR family fatty acid metabolism transcriptional regulator